jgi:putative peptidoglycan lipid II flippase
VVLIFERGRYGPDAAAWTAATVVFQCVGLVFAASQRIGTQALYALKDYRGPVLCALAALGANIVLSLALLGPLGTRGLALANGLSSLLGMLCLVAVLDRRLGRLPISSVVAAWTRMAAASAAMGLVAWTGSKVLRLDDPLGHLRLGMRLFPLIALAAVLYGVLLLLLKDPDAGLLWRKLRGRIRSA